MQLCFCFDITHSFSLRPGLSTITTPGAFVPVTIRISPAWCRSNEMLIFDVSTLL